MIPIGRTVSCMLAVVLLTSAAFAQPLDPAAFFGKLDLDRPELAEVRKAVRQGQYDVALGLWRDCVVERLRARDFGEFGWHGYKGHPRPVALAKYYCGTATQEEVAKWHPKLAGADGTAERITQGNFEEPFPSLVYCYWETGEALYLRRAMELMSGFCATNQPEYWRRYRARLSGEVIPDRPQLDDWRLNVNALATGWRWKNIMQTLAGMAKCLGPDRPQQWQDILSSCTGVGARDKLDLVDPQQLALIAISGYEHHAGRLLWFCLSPGAVPNQRSTGLKALAMLSLIFPEFRHAPALTELIDRAYTEMLQSNFLPDGGSLEQSFNYNAEDMRGLQEVASLYGDDAPRFARTMLTRAEARRVVSDGLKTPIGGLPQVGNSHQMPGVKVWESDEAASRYAEWLQAQDDLAVEKKEFLSKAYPYSGFYAMRDGWGLKDLYLFYMNGRPQRGHSMRDNLSVQVTAYGRQMLVCGGPPTYGNPRNEDARGADFYLSEASSFKCNTVLVDGKSQAKNAPKTSVAPQTPVPGRWHTSASFDLVDGRYALGYETPDPKDRQLDMSVTHERTVVFVRGAKLWVIVDRMLNTGADDHRYTQVWNLPPYAESTDRRMAFSGFRKEQVTLNPRGRRFGTVDPDGPNLELIQFGPPTIMYRKYYGDRENSLGWYARGIGDATPAVDLHASWDSRESDVLITILAPRDKNTECPVVSAESLDGVEAGIAGFRCTLRDGGRLALLACATPHRLDLEGFRADADMLLVYTHGGTLQGIVRGSGQLVLPGKETLAVGSDCFEFAQAPGGGWRTEAIFLPQVPSITPEPLPVLDMADHPPIVIRGDAQGMVIRYTLDGTDPDETSAVYREPIVLHGPTTVKARLFRDGVGLPLCATRHYRPWRWSLRAPDRTDAAGLEPGLRYSHTKRDRWSRLYDLMKDAEYRPLESGLCASMTHRPQDKLTRGQSAVVFDGYLRVPRDGLYTFHVTAKDGVYLFIRNSLRDLELPAVARCMYTDGHGRGTAALRAGFHRLRVGYKKSHDDDELQVEVEGPGIPRQPLPDRWLYRVVGGDGAAQ